MQEKVFFLNSEGKKAVKQFHEEFQDIIDRIPTTTLYILLYCLQDSLESNTPLLNELTREELNQRLIWSLNSFCANFSEIHKESIIRIHEENFNENFQQESYTLKGLLKIFCEKEVELKDSKEQSLHNIDLSESQEPLPKMRHVLINIGISDSLLKLNKQRYPKVYHIIHSILENYYTNNIPLPTTLTQKELCELSLSSSLSLRKKQCEYYILQAFPEDRQYTLKEVLQCMYEKSLKESEYRRCREYIIRSFDEKYHKNKIPLPDIFSQKELCDLVLSGLILLFNPTNKCKDSILQAFPEDRQYTLKEVLQYVYKERLIRKPYNYYILKVCIERYCNNNIPLLNELTQEELCNLSLEGLFSSCDWNKIEKNSQEKLINDCKNYIVQAFPAKRKYTLQDVSKCIFDIELIKSPFLNGEDTSSFVESYKQTRVNEQNKKPEL